MLVVFICRKTIGSKKSADNVVDFNTMKITKARKQAKQKPATH